MPNPSGPATNFDNLTSFGVPVLGGMGYPFPIPVSPNTFFVSSVMGGNGFTGGMGDPFATVAFVLANKAVARNTVNPAGTVIVVLPGHAEAISSATAFAMSIAGVTVIGLGIGNQRPLFTLDTGNTTTIPVSADGVSFINCRFRANFLSIAACFTLAAAKYFTVVGCEFFDQSGILDFLNIIKSTGAANTIDGVTANDNVWNSLGTTSVNTFCLSANDIDRATFLRNQINQLTTVDQASLLVLTAGSATALLAAYNLTYRKQATTANGSLINIAGGGTACTGFVAYNFAQTLTTTADKLFTTTVGFAAFENRVTGVVGAQGFPIPAVDS